MYNVRLTLGLQLCDIGPGALAAESNASDDTLRGVAPAVLRELRNELQAQVHRLDHLLNPTPLPSAPGAMPETASSEGIWSHAATTVALPTAVFSQYHPSNSAAARGDSTHPGLGLPGIAGVSQVVAPPSSASGRGALTSDTSTLHQRRVRHRLTPFDRKTKLWVVDRFASVARGQQHPGSTTRIGRSATDAPWPQQPYHDVTPPNAKTSEDGEEWLDDVALQHLNDIELDQQCERVVEALMTEVVQCALAENESVTDPLTIDGADDSLGYALLHYMAHFNCARSLSLLRGRDVDLDVPAAGGMRALHLAAGAGHVEAVDILLAAGANPSQRNDSGQTCADW